MEAVQELNIRKDAVKMVEMAVYNFWAISYWKAKKYKSKALKEAYEELRKCMAKEYHFRSDPRRRDSLICV